MTVRMMVAASDSVSLTPINAGIGPDAIFKGGREAWLQKIINIWRPYFLRLGHDLPTRIWISPGRPPSTRWTGSCYPGAASDDGNPHILFIPFFQTPPAWPGLSYISCVTLRSAIAATAHRSGGSPRP